MGKKPGVMFYFELRPCLKRLSAEEKGVLFEAILDYSECGVCPDFDGMLGIAWDFIQPRLDKDEEAYVRAVQQRQYAVYVRESKKRGTEPMSFDEWLALSENDLHRDASDDIGRYPTTNTTTNSNTTTNAISNTISNTNTTPASNAISTTKNNTREAEKPPTRTQRLIPPKPEEIRAYAQSQGYASLDPQAFIDYYEANGWKVGKNPMKDWKAAVRNWMRKEKKYDTGAGGSIHGAAGPKADEVQYGICF